MTKYSVRIIETLTYDIEVEAENEQQAENLAYASDEFAQNMFVDNDSVVDSIVDMDEVMEKISSAKA